MPVFYKLVKEMYILKFMYTNQNHIAIITLVTIKQITSNE